MKTEAGRGTFVADGRDGVSGHMAPWRYSDTYSVFDVFQTRLMLEGQIAALAAGRLTANQIEQIEQATRQMEECWARQDRLANVEADLNSMPLSSRPAAMRCCAPSTAPFGSR